MAGHGSALAAAVGINVGLRAAFASAMAAARLCTDVDAIETGGLAQRIGAAGHLVGGITAPRSSTARSVLVDARVHRGHRGPALAALQTTRVRSG
jgi:hypothetical protein